MKRCPTCNKIFTDENLSYCVDDGTPLAVINQEDELTEVIARAGSESPPPPSYQPPPYAAADGKGKRKTWPLIVTIVGLLVLALAGLSIAAVIFIPRMVKRSNPVIVSRNNTNNENRTVPPADNNSNSDSSRPAETNSNTQANLNSPPPTDKELVLSQLKDLEHEWTVANLNADKKKLGSILADDYVGPTPEGGMQGKAEYISTIERDTSVQKWDFGDLQVTLRGDRATLTGKVTFQIQNRDVVYNFIDRFVWREGRWQATGSEVNRTQ